MSHNKFARRYGFLLSQHITIQDPLSVSVAILHQFNVPSEMFQVGFTKLFFRTGQLGVLEDARSRTLHGILRVQSCYKGQQARRYFENLKKATATIQSFVRGKKTRKEYVMMTEKHRAALRIQKHVKGWIDRNGFKDVQDASVVIQSVIRGWLVRRCSGDTGLVQFGSDKGDNSEEEVVVKSSYIAELQRRVLKAEAALREREEESDIFQQRLQEYENRWSDYELKMKSMEEVWQRQMRSLQSSLSIARKTLTMEDSERNSDASVNGTSDERENTTSWECIGRRGGHENNGYRPMGAGLSVITRLAEEFEERSQVFGDDAKFLVEVKSGQLDANLDPDRELRRLKQMFEVWKKDYESRLKETKMVLVKLGNEDGGSGDKGRKKWWGRKNSLR